MNDFYRASIEASHEAMRLIRDRENISLFSKNGFVGAGGDISSGLDLELERIFVKYLSKFGKIDSEESGLIGDGKDSIILDPLDGSSNALSHFPYYGVSIARLNAQGILTDAYVANLANGDIFYLDDNEEALQGSLFNNDCKKPILAPNPEIGIFEKAYAYPKIVSALDEEGLKFRTPGAVALSLAYTHTLNYFIFIGSYRLYDFAAGLALCKGMEIEMTQDYIIIAKDIEILKRVSMVVNSALSIEDIDG